jgi:hypothetical protein
MILKVELSKFHILLVAYTTPEFKLHAIGFWLNYNDLSKVCFCSVRYISLFYD